MEYTKIGKINEYVSQSINPMKTPDTVFEMYSVPVFDTGHPEYLRGDEIASSKIVVQKDDILLCKINPRINRVWVVDDESDKQNIASSEWIVIRNSAYNPEFLAWYFRTPKFQKLMTSEVTGIGGSLTRAQPKRVAEYPVPILERSRQDKIVCALNRVKHIIDARRRELEELDNLIKSRFVEMFSDCEKVQLSMLANITMGQSPDSSSYNDDMKGVPFFQGKADYGEKYTIVRHWTTNPSKMASRGDVLMSVRAPVGPVNIASEDCCIGRGLCAINAKHQYTNNEFLYCALKVMETEIAGKGTGSTFKAITKNDVFELLIPNAEINLQNKFAAFVAQVDKLKFEVQKSLDETQILMDSLMQHFFG